MKRKVLSVLLILAMCLTMFPTMAFADGEDTIGLKGSGTADDPYLISSVADLQTFRDAVNSGRNEICGKLTDDIPTVYFRDILPSIGTADYPYMGTFDGDGHYISTYIYSSTVNRGVFGCIGTSGIVKNLAIREQVGGENSSGLAYSNAGTIAHCTVYGWDAKNISKAIGYGLDDNKTYDSSLSGGDKYGGIVNTNTSSGRIIDCCVLGPMRVGFPEYTAGGIAYSNSGRLENCYFLGKIWESRNNTELSSATAIAVENTGTVENCYYLKYDDNTAVAGTALTKEQFESGEAACLLNNGRTGAAAVWRQNLTGNDDGAEVDRGPMLDSAHGCVYREGTEGNYTYYSLVPHKHGEAELTAWRSADSMPTEAGTYYLTKDVTLTTEQEIRADVSICLNGHAVKADVTVQNSGKLTLTDCKKGSFDGKITVDDGGACTLNEGIFHVEVTNNGAFVANDSTLTGKDTAVTNNGTFEMNGGSITGNTKGVINNSNMNISGAANITGNTDSNLCLADGKTITFGELDERADIGITAEKQGDLNDDEIISISANGADNLDCISADNAVSFEICVSGEGLALCRFKGHKHCICGLSADTKETVKGHDKHTEKTFNPWLASDSLPETSGAYYLTQNVTLNATWQPPADTVLCLNGKTITYNGKALEVTGGTVTITDCAKSWKAGTVNPTAETASVAKDGILILYRGKLAGKHGIDVNGAFEMYGGTVTDSTNSGVRLNNNAAFTMNGGTITGNSTSQHGAGVYVTSGTFTMNGGEITENSIAGGDGDGGGVYVAHGANFIMNDGTISRNTLGAKTCHGGGVFVFGTFEMNNGEISDNSTEGAGGGVFLRGWDSDPAGSSKFIMRGGRITGNTSNVLMGGKDYDTGAGVYVDSSGYFYLDKDPDTDIIITGNTKKSDGAARNVYLGPTKASGSPPGHTISITAPLTGTIRMGVTTEKTLYASGVTIAKTADEAYITGVKLYDIFTSDKDSGYFAARYTATSKDIVLKKHSTHEYSSYEASGSTITEKCSECGQSGGTLTIAAPDAESLVYDGTAKTATVTASDDWNGTAANQVDVTYTKKDDSSFTGVPKEAGTYTAGITLGDATASTDEYTIVPKEVSVSGITVENKKYDGNIDAKISSKGTLTGAVDGDDLDYDVTNAKFINENVGNSIMVTFTVALTGTKAENYMLASDSQKSATASITPGEITPVLTVKGCTYGDAAKPAVEGNLGGGAVTYYYNTDDSNSGGTEWTKDVKLNVGTYYMYAQIAASDNYKAGTTAAVKFTVVPKQVTVSGITAADKDYDGKTDAVLDAAKATIDGMVAGDDLTVTAGGAFENADAGKDKTVKISNLELVGDDAGNYVLADTGNQETATAAINRKETAITAAAVEDKTYDGNAEAVVTNVTIAGVNGELVKDTDFEIISASFPDADADESDADITINVKLIGDAANNYKLTNGAYTAVSAAKINKAANTVSSSDIDAVYGDTGIKISVSDAIGDVTYAITNGSDVVSVDENGEITILKAGKAEIKISAAGNTNYAAGNAVITVTAAKKAVTIKVDDQTKTKGDSDPEFTGTVIGLVNDNDLGTITYKRADEDKDKESVTDDISITAVYTKNDNYDVTVEPGKLTIKRRTGTLTPVQNPEIVAGDGGNAEISKDGTSVIITPDEGKEVDKVLVNGKDIGAVTEVKDLKPGDKIEVIFKDKAEEDLDSKVKAAVEGMTLKARSVKTSKKNIRINAIESITDKLPDGYTVKYKYYRSTKKASGYKFMTAKSKNYYINTKGIKGTGYYYKVRVAVYNKDGKLIAQTELKQCKYATRVWTKQSKKK